MEALLKTKDVSKELGVNGKTVLKWVNFFGIDCLKNNHGHYEFRNEDVQNLKMIQKELSRGIPMREVLIALEEKRTAKTVILDQVEVFDEKFERVFDRLDQLERKIHMKADDVLSYQVLQHRKEIESLAEKITRVEERLLNMEQNVYREIAATKV